MMLRFQMNEGGFNEDLVTIPELQDIARFQENQHKTS